MGTIWKQPAKLIRLIILMSRRLRLISSWPPSPSGGAFRELSGSQPCVAATDDPNVVLNLFRQERLRPLLLFTKTRSTKARVSSERSEAQTRSGRRSILLVLKLPSRSPAQVR
uniref:Putative secreted protein n=1 Tax=Anopheles marajoara TaxID=58244 RepID=A0A2M4C7T0_9DIPT